MAKGPANTSFIADTNNNLIRVIDLTSKNMSTLQLIDGPQPRVSPLDDDGSLTSDAPAKVSPLKGAFHCVAFRSLSQRKLQHKKEMSMSSSTFNEDSISLKARQARFVLESLAVTQLELILNQRKVVCVLDKHQIFRSITQLPEQIQKGSKSKSIAKSTIAKKEKNASWKMSVSWCPLQTHSQMAILKRVCLCLPDNSSDREDYFQFFLLPFCRGCLGLCGSLNCS